MVNKNNKGSFEALKKEVERNYISRSIVFSIIYLILSFLLFVSFDSFMPHWLVCVLIGLVSVMINFTFMIMTIYFIKRKKYLRFIDFVFESNIYVINFLFIATMFSFLSNGSKTADNLNSIISLYSISWAICGISIAVFGIWMSVSGKNIFGKKESLEEKYTKFSSSIGLLFVFGSIVISVIVQLAGVAILLADNPMSNYSFYIATIYVSAYSVTNVLLFLFIPLFRTMFENNIKNGRGILSILHDHESSKEDK